MNIFYLNVKVRGVGRSPDPHPSEAIVDLSLSYNAKVTAYFAY